MEEQPYKSFNHLKQQCSLVLPKDCVLMTSFVECTTSSAITWYNQHFYLITGPRYHKLVTSLLNQSGDHDACFCWRTNQGVPTHEGERRLKKTSNQPVTVVFISRDKPIFNHEQTSLSIINHSLTIKWSNKSLIHQYYKFLGIKNHHC